MNKEDIPAVLELVNKAFDEIIRRLKADIQEIFNEMQDILNN